MSDSSGNPVFDLALAYQKTAAFTAAVKLDVFSLIGRGTLTATELADKTKASPRGVRILCDSLVVLGLLDKQGTSYSLTRHAQVFLDRASPLEMGSIVDFVAAPETIALFFDDPASYVRRGGSQGLANVAPNHPIWVRFARAMVPFALPTAKRVASYVASLAEKPYTVLDVAAGHGMYGIEVARAVPEAIVTAIDWPDVVAVARANAEAANVRSRYRAIEGNALEAEWGGDFDLILLPNFLHHFDFETCVSLLKKVKANLADGGQALAVDFVPNEDRVSPALPALFAFWMLATTPGGDAYTPGDLDAMAKQAGFRGASVRALAPTPQTLIVLEN